MKKKDPSPRVLFSKEQNKPTFSLKPQQADTLFMYEVGKITQSQANLEQILNSLLDMLLFHFSAKQGHIYLSFHEKTPLSIFLKENEELKLSPKPFSLSHSIINKALEGTGTVSTNTSEDERFGPNSTVHKLNIRSIICVPIYIFHITKNNKEEKGFPAGVIYLGEGFFTRGHLDLLTAVGKQIGLAVERKYREEEETEIRKIFETKVQNASKLEALGLFSAGIVHEIGNPLASMYARLQRLENNQDPTFVLQSVELLKNQVNRMKQILQSIASFAKTHSRRLRLCNLEKMIKETLELLLLDPRSKKVKINVNIEPKLPYIMVSKNQIQQAFINIAINALEAMPEGGELSISASCNKEICEIVFRDTGMGISEENTKRIFDPFFSTKSSDVRIGLGLYLSLSYIQAHGGSVKVKSEINKGSSFFIHFPLGENASVFTKKEENHEL